MTPSESPLPAPAVPPETFPVKPGDWISNDSGRVAKVKAVYGSTGELCIDLWLYDRKGERTGRESPACGGPRSFEPACSWDGWFRIDEPTFPAPLRWVPCGDGKVTARHVAGKRLPDRAWTKPVRRRALAIVTHAVPGNIDAETQARARRIAAEELRDVARTLGKGDMADTLRSRAKALEAEADALAPRH